MSIYHKLHPSPTRRSADRCYFLYLRFETEPITMFRVGAYRQEAEA